MAHVLAENAVLFRNTGTYASPVWDAVSQVKDLSVTQSKGEVDVTTRASGGYVEIVDGLKEASIEFSVLYDTADTDFVAILAAYHANTAIEFFVGDGAAATGTQGLRADCLILKADISETLGEALMCDFSAKPIKNADSAPTWFTHA